MTDLPQFVCDMLASPPKTGDGVHPWLFRTSRQLHAHRSEDQIVKLLCATTSGCGRPVPEREIVEAVRDSKLCAWEPGGLQTIGRRTPKWPPVDRDARRDVIREAGIGLADLHDSSPVWWDDAEPHTEELIDALFPGDPLLCCGVSADNFDTLPREARRGEHSEQALIVPSPMSQTLGRRKSDNKLSKHTLDNTADRRFLVVEFDTGSTDDHAATHYRLARIAPLALCVHSGGKSLHGWYYCEGIAESALLKFMRYAVSIGADYATWSRSQFVRMPDGLRADGCRQRVFYFNPGVIR